MPAKSFFIRSLLNGLVLDIESSKKVPGTKVVTWHKKDKDNDNQLWFEDQLTGVIRSKLSPDLCLTISGDNFLVVDHLKQGQPNQRWQCTANRVQNRDDSNRVLDVSQSAVEPGSRICSWAPHGGPNQQWAFDFVEPRYFYIKSEMNGKVIDVKSGIKTPGAEICMWTKNEGKPDNQLWYQDPEGLIRSKLTDFALDSGDVNLIRVNPYAGSAQQKWIVSANKIARLDNPKRVLDIRGEKKDDGAHICEYDCHDKPNQLWQLEYVN